MFSMALFLGFPVDASLSEALESVDSKLAVLFLENNDAHYLKEVVYQDVRYLGKFAGEITNLANLTLLEANIYSLLKKVVPDYSFRKNSLVLFPASL